MNLAPTAPRTKPVAHKTLKNAPIYVSVSDSDVVVEFNLSIEKIGRVLDEKGNPAINPGDNLPIYWFGHNLIGCNTFERGMAGQEATDGGGKMSLKIDFEITVSKLKRIFIASISILVSAVIFGIIQSAMVNLPFPFQVMTWIASGIGALTSSGLIYHFAISKLSAMAQLS